MKLYEELKNLKEFTSLQKILIGLLIVSLVMLVPESAFLLDVGGIDLILFILLMYSQNIQNWYTMYFGSVSYPPIQTQTFVVHSTVSSVFLWVTGSVVLSYGFFLVLMFMHRG
jgi:hypothetical protein